MRHRIVAVRPQLIAIVAFAAVSAAAVTLAGWPAPSDGEEQSTTREFTIHASKYAFDPDRIEVQKDDLVKITFHADDIPHSFTLDAYRISKRAAPGSPVVFEFRADRVGRFPYRCSLTIDEGCSEMRGELIVYAR